MPDGTTDRSAVVLVAQRERGAGGIRKRRSDGKRFIAIVVVGIAMEMIGAGLGGDVQVAAWAAAGFAVAGGLERVLVERVNGVNNAGDAADAALTASAFRYRSLLSVPLMV